MMSAIQHPSSTTNDLFPESLFTPSNPLCQDISLWSAPSEMAAEIEVSDFLCALVYLLKPRVIIETGCHLGDTSIRLAASLQRNGVGLLRTCDIEEDCIDTVRRRALLAGLPLEAHVMTGVELIDSSIDVDFAFIDSGGNRVSEISLLLPKLTRFAVVAVHDTAPHHFDASKLDGMHLRQMYFNTPRGLTLLQKV